MKHTPGPWTVSTGSVYVDNSEEWPIVPIAHMDREVDNGTVPVERDANARLIAAAPSLLAALEMALRLIEGENLDEIFDGETETIREAIKEATA